MEAYKMRTRDSTLVEITVEGHLDSRWDPVFQGMELLHQRDGTTVIRGPGLDQAALHGLLRRIRDSRMVLVAIRQIKEEPNNWRKSMKTNANGKRKNVVIFGATGRSGSAVVRRALERGHSVTAFVRNPDGMKTVHPKLRIITGDVLNPNSVEEAVRGQDAVVSCLGAGLKGRIRSEGTRNIIQAMERTGVTRLISQSSLGVGDSRGNLNAYWKYIMFGLLLRKAYADHGLQERYIRESPLDWTIVRPAALEDGEATGDYLHGFSADQEHLTLTISTGDLGQFIVGELEEAAYVSEAPGLSYAGARR
jgi:putative NADH-flavin reductase